VQRSSKSAAEPQTILKACAAIDKAPDIDHEERAHTHL
jgi:hypothetical protein